MALNLNQTYDETRRIKVLVVPVGKNSLFDTHFQVVSQLREVPFYELTRPALLENTLKHFSWNANSAKVLYDYVRYDRVSFGPGDLDNFQSSRRVLIIMGLINYPELTENVESGKSIKNVVEEDLDYYSRRHPHILLKRLFVFNYKFDMPSSHLSTSSSLKIFDDPAAVVIFPPEGNCQEGQTNMVEVHLKEVMSHDTVKMITSISAQMELCEMSRLENNIPNTVPLTTIHDEIDAMQYNQEETGEFSRLVSTSGISSALVSSISARSGVIIGTKGKFRKRPSGRLQKWMGDLSLQVCSPIDAIERYTAAISECKALNDELWLAGAYDGYACAILLLLQVGEYNIEEILGKELKTSVDDSVDGSTQSPIAPSANDDNAIHLSSTIERSCMRLAEDKASDALAIYSRNIIYSTLEVECCLRLARMHEKISFTANKERKVLEYIFSAIAVPGLNKQQQTEITIEGALIFHRLGMKRKFALLLYIAALLCAENDNFSVAQSLMQYAFEQYQQMPGNENKEASSFCTDAIFDYKMFAFSTEEDHTRIINNKWVVLSATLFVNGALIAKEAGDNVTAINCIASLLGLTFELEKDHKNTRDKWHTGLLDQYNNLLTKYNQLKNQIPTQNRQQANVLDLVSNDNQSSSISRTPMTILTPNETLSETPNTSISDMNTVYSTPSFMTPSHVLSSKVTPFQKHLSQSKSPIKLTPNTSTITSKKMNEIKYQRNMGENDSKNNMDKIMNSIDDQNFLSVPRLHKRLLSLLGIEKSADAGHKLFDLSIIDFKGSKKKSQEFISLAESFLEKLQEVEVYRGATYNPTMQDSLSSQLQQVVDELKYVKSLLVNEKISIQQQEEYMKALVILAKIVKPDTAILLPVSIHNISILDMKVVQNLSEIETGAVCTARDNLKIINKKLLNSQGLEDVTSSVGDRSALFYDPFMVKRKEKEVKMSKRNTLSTKIWLVNTVCKVEVVLQNYLSVPLCFDQIEILASGCNYKSYPVPCVIPACSYSHKVYLTIIPVEEGDLEIQGIKILFENTYQIINPKKCNIHGSADNYFDSTDEEGHISLKVKILPEMSLQKIYTPFGRHRSFTDYDTDKDASDGKDSADLRSIAKYDIYSGEDLNIPIHIFPSKTQLDKLPIADLKITLLHDKKRYLLRDFSGPLSKSKDTCVDKSVVTKVELPNIYTISTTVDTRNQDESKFLGKQATGEKASCCIELNLNFDDYNQEEEDKQVLDMIPLTFEFELFICKENELLNKLISLKNYNSDVDVSTFEKYYDTDSEEKKIKLDALYSQKLYFNATFEKKKGIKIFCSKKCETEIATPDIYLQRLDNKLKVMKMEKVDTSLRSYNTFAEFCRVIIEVRLIEIIIKMQAIFEQILNCTSTVC